MQIECKELQKVFYHLIFMKKLTLLIFATLLLFSCDKNMDKAMKSADKKYILQVANDKFAQKKWKDALSLYERLPNLVAGTDDAPHVLFNSAYANYYEKQYRLAGHQFKNFSVTFPQDPRAEEAAYMSALCYYEGSQDYNLDQSNTELAINELQNFLNAYPSSERAKNINNLIEELSYKLEFKAYENAKQYYKMEEYKAAIITFENVLNDYPATKLRPDIYKYLMKSRYELAMGSRYDLKEERLDNAIAFTKEIDKQYPDYEIAKETPQLREKLLKEKADFAIVIKNYEADKAKMEARQKAEAEKLAKAEEEKLARKQRKEAAKKAKDSIKALK